MKINVSYWWIVMLPLVFSLNMEKVLLFVFVLLSVHESMHILIAKKFGYSVTCVTVYPFGLMAHIHYFEYKKSIWELIIIIAGLLVHIVVIPLLYLCQDIQLISNAFMEYLMMINIQILLFNLIPIYPLDGGRIVRNILEVIFTYKVAKTISIIISFFILVIYINIMILDYVSGVLFIALFIIQYALIIFNFHKDVNAFYLYRYLYGANFKQKIHHKNDIYKNRYNVVFRNKKMYLERELLDELLNKRTNI